MSVVVTVSQACAFVKINQFVDFKYAGFIVCPLYLNKDKKKTQEKCQKQQNLEELRDELRNRDEEISRRAQHWKTTAEIQSLKMRHKSRMFVCSFQGWNWIAHATWKSPPARAWTRFHQRNAGGGIVQLHRQA